MLWRRYMGCVSECVSGCMGAQAHVSGDVDGIFGGSPQTYVRDLQFKALTTTIMVRCPRSVRVSDISTFQNYGFSHSRSRHQVMSGWARNPDKQPWTYGEPFTSINRASLKLKASLTISYYPP